MTKSKQQLLSQKVISVCNPDFPTRPGYEEAHPKGWNASAGLRWEYWLERGFVEARGGYAVDEVACAPADLLFDEPVDVGIEAREALVEIARELQIPDDLPVEALTGDQQRNSRRIRRQQHARDAPLEVVDLDALDLAMRHARERVGGPHRRLEVRKVHLGRQPADVIGAIDAVNAVAQVAQADLLVTRMRDDKLRQDAPERLRRNDATADAAPL